jgi:hypothetical protein
MLKMRLYFLSIWSILDPIYYLFTRLIYLEDGNQQRNIFRVRLTRYKGKEVILKDGTTIKKNDVLVKIHLHNVRLLRDMNSVESDTKRGRIIYKHVLNGMPSLAHFIHSHPRCQEIKGIIGITMLHKGCNRLGFETYDINNPVYRFIKQVVFVPMYCLSVSKINSQSIRRQPKYLFMSKEALLALYKR